jgi:cytidyltransferase-like protein
MEMKTVYAAGVWDFCHEGHVRLFEYCRKIGDLVVIGVNSDKFTESYKKVTPHENELKRLDNIRKLGIADVVFILEDHESQSKYIDIFKPNVIVHGNDWKGGSLQKQMNISDEQIGKYDIEFVYPEYTAGISSTMLREKIKL